MNNLLQKLDDNRFVRIAMKTSLKKPYKIGKLKVTHKFKLRNEWKNKYPKYWDIAVHAQLPSEVYTIKTQNAKDMLWKDGKWVNPLWHLPESAYKTSKQISPAQVKKLGVKV